MIVLVPRPSRYNSLYIRVYKVTRAIHGPVFLITVLPAACTLFPALAGLVPSFFGGRCLGWFRYSFWFCVVVFRLVWFKFNLDKHGRLSGSPRDHVQLQAAAINRSPRVCASLGCITRKVYIYECRVHCTVLYDNSFITLYDTGTKIEVQSQRISRQHRRRLVGTFPNTERGRLREIGRAHV